MPKSPLLPESSLSDSVEDLADLLFSGLAERPMWNSFLKRIVQRLHADASAFVISSRGHAALDSAVVVPDGRENEPFNRLSGLEAFSGIDFDRPQMVAVREDGFPAGDYAVLRLQFDSDRSFWLICAVPASGVAALAADWREVMLALLPLLLRIAPLYLVIGEAERQRRIAEYVLETSGVGVILVDGAGAVITANVAARAIMAQTRVLDIHAGLLQARRQTDQKLLMQHVREKADQQSANDTQPGCYAAFALLRDDHHLPVTVMVRPGPPYGPVSAPLYRTATVILRDPARRLGLAGPDLEQLFGLSPAEAKLARLLADGLSMEETALQLGVSRNTVRSQLQAVFAKTGTNRQGDLVRLLLSSSAALAQRGGGPPLSTMQL